MSDDFSTFFHRLLFDLKGQSYKIFASIFHQLVSTLHSDRFMCFLFFRIFQKFTEIHWTVDGQLLIGFSKPVTINYSLLLLTPMISCLATRHCFLHLASNTCVQSRARTGFFKKNLSTADQGYGLCRAYLWVRPRNFYYKTSPLLIKAMDSAKLTFECDLGIFITRLLHCWSRLWTLQSLPLSAT